MKIVVDTNILLSAAFFPQGIVSEVMLAIADGHELILSNTVMEEAKMAAAKKFPAKIDLLETYFAKLNYRYQEVLPTDVQNLQADIDDPKDKHVLAAAFLARAPLIVTGDKHFFSRTYPRIEILTPADFLKKYAPRGRGDFFPRIH